MVAVLAPVCSGARCNGTVAMQDQFGHALHLGSERDPSLEEFELFEQVSREVLGRGVIHLHFAGPYSLAEGPDPETCLGNPTEDHSPLLKLRTSFERVETRCLQRPEKPRHAISISTHPFPPTNGRRTIAPTLSDSNDSQAHRLPSRELVALEIRE